MLIDRRSLLTGIAATVAAAAVPTVPGQATTRSPLRLRVAAFPFGPDTDFEVGHRAIRRLQWLSRFHFDPETYPGHHFIRHEASGLVFQIEQYADHRVYVRRIFLRSDPKDLSHERYLLIGNATRRAADQNWPYSQKCGIQCWDYTTKPWRTHWQDQPPLRLDT